MRNLNDMSFGKPLRRGKFDRVGDLINIDGPLLTLFQDKEDDILYLYDWMDSDANSNRYIIYRISPSDLISYIGKRITHIQLYSKAIDGIYFYADIDRQRPLKYEIYQLRSLPHEYSLTEGTLFSEEYCNDTEGLLLFASRTRAAEESENSFESIAILESKVAEKGLNVSRRGVNTIYVESIKTKEAHVRQAYNLPSGEGLEVYR